MPSVRTWAWPMAERTTLIPQLVDGLAVVHEYVLHSESGTAKYRRSFSARAAPVGWPARRPGSMTRRSGLSPGLPPKTGDEHGLLPLCPG